MSSHSPVLGEALLGLPGAEAGPLNLAAVHLDDVHEKLSVAHARAYAQARAGEEIFRVAFALQESKVDEFLPLITSEFTQSLHTVSSKVAHDTANTDSNAQCMMALHAQAASLVAAGDINGAITLLCALLDWDETRNDALLGLAICAVRIERYDAALTLGLDYLKRGGRHPRAHCIIGVCFLKNGDRRSAQNHLAIAARAARADIAYRDELRAAQRLLIMLNFGR